MTNQPTTLRRIIETFLFCCILLGNGETVTPQAPTPQSPSGSSQEQEGGEKPKASGAGGMRRAPSGALLLPLLAATLLQDSTKIGPAQKTGAAIPSLNHVEASSKAESYVLESVRDGRVADLSGLADRSLSAGFVDTLLFRTAASAVPTRLVSIRGATIKGDVSIPRGSSPVPNNIVFNKCIFEDRLNLKGGRFEQSLIFLESEFHRGWTLESAEVKGDVVFVGGSVDQAVNDPATLDRAQIDGQLQFVGLKTKSILAQSLKVRNAVLILDDYGIENIELPRIDAESLFLGHHGSDSIGDLGVLNIEQGTLTSGLWIQDSTIGSVELRGLHVNGITKLGPNFTVKQDLNLEYTHHRALAWIVPKSRPKNELCNESTPGWPCLILASGLTFDDDLAITTQTSDDSQKSLPQLNDQFLDEARSSESAFVAYEQILRSRGELAHADDTYSGMRAKRRAESWNSSSGFRQCVHAIIFIVLDKMQAIFLGYGRLPLPPLLWSIGIVTLGTFLFVEKTRMGRSTKEETGGVPYSRFWYSLELFLPVVDLGMAKGWRPQKRALRAYARIHQLAGWILIPVSLAALTGAIK